MKRFHGFTAVELMVVIAIVAILATLALPSFASLIKKFQLERDVRALESTIYVARSEAMKRGGNVRMAKTTCPTASTEWDCGWTVSHVPTGGTALIIKQVNTAQKNNINVNVSGVVNFDRWGGVNVARGFTIQPKNDSSVEMSREVCISSGGRVRVAVGADSCL